MDGACDLDDLDARSGQTTATTATTATTVTAPAIAPTLDTVKRLILLKKLKSDLERELKTVAADIEAVQPAALEFFAQSGVSSVRVDGRTAYLHRSLYASRADETTPADACAALRAAGYGNLVEEKFNHQTLSALWRELEQSDEGVPDVMLSAFKTTQKFDIRVKK